MWGVVLVDPQLPCFLCLTHWPCGEAVFTFGISAGQDIHANCLALRKWLLESLSTGSFFQPAISLNRCWIISICGISITFTESHAMMPWQTILTGCEAGWTHLADSAAWGQRGRDHLYSRARCSLQGRVPTEPTDSGSFRVHQVEMSW